MNAEGEPKKATFVLDISERKRAERRLSETVDRLEAEIEERKRLEKVRDQVERMVRHDLKNPLNGILGVAQILMQEDWPKEREELVRMVYDSGMQILNMVDNMFDYLRMEDGTYRLQPERFDVGSFVRALCSEFAHSFDTEKIGLDCRINGQPLEQASEGAHFFTGERMQLKTVFSNLLRNAFEASGEGDTVRLDVEIDGSLRVRIHNPAPVPREVRDSFFERYVTHGKSRGNGLGTYIARLITEYHGGSMDYRTDERDGTTVFLDIPGTESNHEL